MLWPEGKMPNPQANQPRAPYVDWYSPAVKTTKLVLIDPEGTLLYSYYGHNKGNPVDVVREQLAKIYEQADPGMIVAGSAVTGYGEELIQRAFILRHFIATFLQRGVFLQLLVDTLVQLDRRQLEHTNHLNLGGRQLGCLRERLLKTYFLHKLPITNYHLPI